MKIRIRFNSDKMSFGNGNQHKKTAGGHSNIANGKMKK
jgi:hypothetical protein